MSCKVFTLNTRGIVSYKFPVDRTLILVVFSCVSCVLNCGQIVSGGQFLILMYILVFLVGEVRRADNG